MLLPFALIGCSHPELDYIEFDSAKYMVSADNEGDFQPLRVMVDDLEKIDVPQTKANGFNMTAIVQGLIDQAFMKKTISVVGTYHCVDPVGETVKVSGRVVLPPSGDIRNVILVSHYTIGADSECPSNTFPLEGILASRGYALVFPDYIGFGITKETVHPYMSMKSTVSSCWEMYLAVSRYLEKIGRKPLSDEIYLMGFSQGGGTTIANQHAAEVGEYRDKGIKIKRVFAGGGPYDLGATFDFILERGQMKLSSIAPMIVLGMNYGESLNLDLSKLFTPNLYAKYKDVILSKDYILSHQTEMLGTMRIDGLLTETVLNKEGQDMAHLYAAMLYNSAISWTDWEPVAPIYMFHSQNDDTVPYVNAQRFKSKYKNCSNVEYNFGYYGDHVMSCMRFIFNVITLLSEEH